MISANSSSYIFQFQNLKPLLVSRRYSAAEHVWIFWTLLYTETVSGEAPLGSTILFTFLFSCSCHLLSSHSHPVPSQEQLSHSVMERRIVCFAITLFSSVQSLSRVRLFATPWTTTCQASLSIKNSQSQHKPMSIESVMLSNHLILCRPLLLPSIFPSIRVFSNDSTLRMR